MDNQHLLRDAGDLDGAEPVLTVEQLAALVRWCGEDERFAGQAVEAIVLHRGHNLLDLLAADRSVAWSLRVFQGALGHLRSDLHDGHLDWRSAHRMMLLSEATESSVVQHVCNSSAP